MRYDFTDTRYTRDEISDFLNYTNLSIKDKKDIIIHQEIDDSLVVEHPDLLFPEYEFAKYQVLSIDFIKKYFDKLNASDVCRYQVLNEDFIREYKDKLNWKMICIWQGNILTDEFMEEMEDYLDFDLLSIYKELSEGFIMDHLEKVNINSIIKHQKISRELIDDIKDIIRDSDKSCWIDYKNTFYLDHKWISRSENFSKTRDEWKYDASFIHGIEVFDDYLIGKKIIRKNRRSLSTNKYEYLEGETYYSFSDYSKDLISFGFGVYGTPGIEDYDFSTSKDEMVIDVKVNYEDITFLGDFINNNFLRANKITILS